MTEPERNRIFRENEMMLPVYKAELVRKHSGQNL